MAGIISVLTKTPFLLNELQKVLPNVVFANIDVPESDLQFKQSNIIIADFDLLGPHIYNLPNAKWVQGTWAGIDALVPFLTKGQPPYPISRFSGNAFGTLMSEYVLANIVNYERDFFTIMDNQRQKKWDINGRISNYRSISDLTIGIMGLGNIGTKIGKQLHSFGGTILGYGRQPKIDKLQFDFVDEYFTNTTIHELLGRCDYLINILPKTKETIGLLNGDTLKHCKEKGTVFINIGRGSIISEEDLIKALSAKWIQAAILDVFENEPLSKESLLWNMSNIFITPHVSGQSRAKDIAVQFKKNFEQFSQNSVAENAINFVKGY